MLKEEEGKEPLIFPSVVLGRRPIPWKYALLQVPRFPGAGAMTSYGV